MRYFHNNWRGNGSRVLVPLLRTCKQINQEASEVYYGENEWRFDDNGGHLKALWFLEHIGNRHSQWLRRLTMCTPVMGEQVYFFKSPIEGSGLGKRKTYTDFHEVLYRCKNTVTFSAVTQRLVQHLESLPRLEELYLVIPPLWHQGHITDNWPISEYKDTPLHPEHQAVWLMFENLVRNNPHIRFTALNVVRLPTDVHINYDHDRHLKSLRNRLGIWDQRMAPWPDNEYWYVSEKTEEHPDTFLESLRMLFT
jgi:hypothetical protein